ncbi:DUF1566 domain-containing protein [Leptospira alstonii]|uniref:PF07603 family protein n=2 Tax=Leptospira alstonii TaxID=28452 RepID=M6CT61_9LEPT|nr:PF07603 family protein [Leptospira alstonii serovar Sichuan str. 79601]EQA82219.1 PF07603 family protein [Leptospira alstonii serovar Pingchang str. 80-412]
MNRKFTFLFFSILLVSKCIAHPPSKPEPPLAMLQHYLAPHISEVEESQTPIATTTSPGPTYNLGAVMDSGQIQCWDAGGIPLACNGTGQDGEFSNTPRPRSFTGPTQHATYLADYTTLDNVRGLTWKSCAEGQSGPTCMGGAATVLSYDTAVGGGAGTCTALNIQNGGNGYAGKTNWRIPTLKELASLVNISNNAPPYIETTQFPNTSTANPYVSSTSNANVPANIWVTDFQLAKLSVTPKNAAGNHLRCVSGNTIPNFSFVDNGNETITDQNTNLLWTKCLNGRSDPNCMSGGNLNSMWQPALVACNGLVLGGRSDWRLPNSNELLSIITYAQLPILPPFFPNNPPLGLWTSTTDPNNSNNALIIDTQFVEAQSLFYNKGGADGTPNSLCVTNVTP